MATSDIWKLVGLIAFVLHTSGILAAVHAIIHSRTSQGAIAWAILLVIFPYISLPLYLIFGRGKFHGYVSARRAGDLQINHIARSLEGHLRPYRSRLEDVSGEYLTLERLAKMPFVGHNDAQLLVDGQTTFEAIFAGIDAAQDYVLVQFFIIHEDELGKELKKRLIDKARQGVRVYVLYDEIGSRKLSGNFHEELWDAGVQFRAFRTTQGHRNRFQLNFRNHRKIVVVDGREAYVGGLNVGDEYMGRSARFGPWRDTHAKIVGPAVQCVQLAFLEDWYWATRDLPELNWTPTPAETANKSILVLPSGPADAMETCGLFFVHAINAARRRLWIASPYFVPDPQLICALQLAALRGVDVRVILPEKPDHWLVYLSAFSYIGDIEPAGAKIYRYQPGFLHQKTLLIDDDFAAVGTANLDNRSVRLNFEIALLFADKPFAAQMHAMLERDLAQCRQVHASELQERGLWFQIAVRIARLMSPIQ